MRPDQGGTLELLLEAEDAQEIVYAAALATPDGEWSGQARVGAQAGDVTLAIDGDPPPWLIGLVRAVLRTIWRSHAGWPRRITRWRPAPDAGQAS